MRQNISASSTARFIDARLSTGLIQLLEIMSLVEKNPTSAVQIGDSEMLNGDVSVSTAEKGDEIDVEDDAMEDVDESTMSLPLSKIKRIFKMDPDYFGSSASAVYATGVATELFVQYLVEHASMLAKLEKRKKIQYKDLSNAVSTQDALNFLSDTIPKTQTIEQAIKEKKINLSENDKTKYSDVIGNDNPPEAEESSSGPTAAPSLPKGQSSLPFEPVVKHSVKKAVIHDLMLNDSAEQNDEPMVIDD